MSCSNPNNASYYSKYCSNSRLAGGTASGFEAFAKSTTLIYIANVIVVGLILLLLYSQKQPLFDPRILQLFNSDKDFKAGEVLPSLLAIYLILFTVISVIIKIIAKIKGSNHLDKVSYYIVAIPSLPIYFAIVIFFIIAASSKYY